MAHLAKYAVLVAVAGLLVWLDLWTKSHADAVLASKIHPLPITVTAEESGRTLAELVAGRYPDLEGDIGRTVSDAVFALDRSAVLDSQANAFAHVDGPWGPRTPLAYLVFHRGLDRSPRRVEVVEKDQLTYWLHFLMDQRPQAEVDAIVEKEFEDLTLDAYLAGRVHGADVEEVRQWIADGRVVPIFRHRGGLDPARTVAEGELFVLVDRVWDVIDGCFRFEYKENPGAAWGLMANARPQFRQFFLSGISALAALVILVIFVHLGARHWSAILAFSGILAGAVGNLIDRVQYNFVIDFIDMYYTYMHWPTYNIADVGITVGVVALVIEMLFVKSSPFLQKEPAEGGVPEGAA